MKICILKIQELLAENPLKEKNQPSTLEMEAASSYNTFIFLYQNAR